MKLRVYGLVCLLACASCTNGKNPLTGSGTITYKVLGTATQVDITYNGEGGSVLQSNGVSVPWSTNVPAKSGDFLYVSAQNDKADTGCVEVQILGGGNVLKDGQSCGAFAVATVSMTY